MKALLKQNCSYQGEAVNVSSAHYDLWSSKNIKN